MVVAPTEDFSAAIAQHDVAVGDTIWVGSEPTFTMRLSEASEWLSEPLGGDKFCYALRMVKALRKRHPGCMVLRSLGRQYQAEDVPRWSLGVLSWRDRSPLWQGPDDPLAVERESPRPGDQVSRLEDFWRALADAAAQAGWHVKALRCEQPLGHRLLFGQDPEALLQASRGPLAGRPSFHSQKAPADGLQDALAERGVWLFSIGLHRVDDLPHGLCVELPRLPNPQAFLDSVALLEQACRVAAVESLVLQGFPPPIDQRFAWVTVTPDPAVIEVNQAPQSRVAAFYAASRELFEVAGELGLTPYRVQYNGNVSDSGGGGQFTLGGETVETSPFLLEPRLLPRLVRYLNRHPVLSYFFAPDYLGSASQSPRPDETTRDALHELALAMSQLQCQETVTPEFLWASMAPFLTDPSGNSHRSELNIEKLWNPYLPGRGCLGLVEFRAFRMPRTAERAAAIAALLRALGAMLMRDDVAPSLRDWGDELHDRFALPYFLAQDLERVFADLADHGFGLHPLIQAQLGREPSEPVWSTVFSGCELRVERALEFWPLVGDVASQESGGSRTVDSSTARLQVSLRQVDTGAPSLDGWSLRIAGFEAPLKRLGDGERALRLVGVRYRDFAPWRGLHPAIAPQGPLVMEVVHPDCRQAIRATLHNWQPQGHPYQGLPESLQVAKTRRDERLVVEFIDAAGLGAAAQPPNCALGPYTVDLRICQLERG